MNSSSLTKLQCHQYEFRHLNPPPLNIQTTANYFSFSHPDSLCTGWLSPDDSGHCQWLPGHCQAMLSLTSDQYKSIVSTTEELLAPKLIHQCPAAAASNFILLLSGSSKSLSPSLGSTLTSTIERDTLGTGSGGGGAGGPLEGVTTTLPLVIEIGSELEFCGSGCRGRDTIGLMVTPLETREILPVFPMMLFAIPSLRMIWVPGCMGVLGGGAEV